MVVFIMEMEALPAKSLEVKQTLLALSEYTRKEKGCQDVGVFQDLENENVLCLSEVWESREELDHRMQADKFSVLLGTRALLSRPPKIIMSEIFRSS